jgi:putative FmdB family regulatory protein
MPTYEYVCTDCGKQLEVVQSFTDDALTECPSCAGRLRKIFGNVGVSFKGSGFYKTDSRPAAKSGASASSSESSESKPAETSTPASTESTTKSSDSTTSSSTTSTSSDSSSKAS